MEKKNFTKLHPGSEPCLGSQPHPGVPRLRVTSTGLNVPPGYLELWVAQHHEGRAGPGTVPRDEGHVHAPDPPQAREGGVPLPGLRVPGHHARLQPGLFPSRTQTSKRARGPRGATPPAQPAPVCPASQNGAGRRSASPTAAPEARAGSNFRQLGGPRQACGAAPVSSATAAPGAVRSEGPWRRPPPAATAGPRPRYRSQSNRVSSDGRSAASRAMVKGRAAPLRRHFRSAASRAVSPRRRRRQGPLSPQRWASRRLSQVGVPGVRASLRALRASGLSGSPGPALKRCASSCLPRTPRALGRAAPALRVQVRTWPHRACAEPSL